VHETYDSPVERLPRTLRVRIRPWPYFGGLALVAVVLQAVTGLIMSFTYQPTPDQAYVSSYYIANVMPYGWLVRTVHTWGAAFIIGFAAIHAVRMFVAGSYKPPWRAGWVFGVLALLAAVSMGFTGHLLPWDQTAYWDTTAAVDLFRQAPVVGGWIAGTLLGGETVTAATLTRFYAMHATILPLGMLALLAGHLWVSRRARELAAADPDDESGEPVPFYPDLFVPGVTSVALLLGVYAVAALLVPAALDVKADPSLVLESAKPAWYFLSIYAASKVVPTGFGVTVTMLLGTAFVFLPFLDRSPARSPRERRFAIGVGLAVIVGIVGFTIAGALM
jgi:quinol-cytochrome oxidoreductase complex cytochrome b subunit